MKKVSGIFDKFLNIVEKGGNALPNPSTLFAIFAFLTIMLSGIAYLLDLQSIHPVTNEIIKINNLLSEWGLHKIMLEMVDNFTSFAPLGIVMVALLGLGIAEGSGLISTVIRLFVLSAPKSMLTFIIVFAGVISNMASTVGYVILIPLAGVVFLAVRRHPIAGMAAAYAGISGGYNANLLIGTVDPLLAGLSQEAARIIDPAYVVNPTANYYFMFISTFLISIAGTWITEKFVEPRLGNYSGEVEPEKIEHLSPEEKKGLKFTLITISAIVIAIFIGMFPEDGIFRGDDGTILGSPLIKGVVSLIFVVAGLAGIAFGFGTGKFKNDDDVIKSMEQSMKSIATYLVLVFFASQFVAYFNWTNLGLIIAIEGANFLAHLGIELIPLMILFIILSGTINLFMGSASAKWALMAPIFVPMFMLLGFSPELTQTGFRIGDSVTNVISPMMSFFALIIVFFQKYDKKAGIGTIVSTMLPYSILFFIFWTILLVFWIWMGFPLGPNSGLHYQM
ncbi:MAG: AbgT family transporter [Melioribacteraceae bacterium]|nr:AbgT family transporter [Melioribacteraceae bacterium]MCF8263766.1 AbgT family transporter [Melioribacteraceae bacterium]MCF8412780.1 AbgT family transporter [Melioribacteraceae bacterium]MCF8430639.1 AbgT family transporter [Melioribacteraceae bacterium]